MRRLVAIALLALLAWPAGGSADPLRLGVIVGNNRGARGKTRLRYAEQDARKMYEVLVSQSGFSKTNLKLLTGGGAGEVWRALNAAEETIARRAAAGDDITLFIFYYSGHADGDVLELGDTTLDFDRLKRFLKRSKATVRLAFVDACHSGVLAARKGGRRVPGFPIVVTDDLDSSGYAVVTSSSDDELSQESEEIRGSFFTHYLISALRGAADSSRDGRVTLNETYQYAYAKTLTRTSRTVAGGQHPMYDFNISGKGEVVLARTGGTRGGVTVTAPSSGRLLILDAKREQLVAELSAEAHRPVDVGLSPGRYVAYNLGDRMYEALFEVRRGTRAEIPSEAFASATLERAVSKGGLFTERRYHVIDTAFVLRRWPLSGGMLSYGAGIDYRLDGWLPLTLAPLLRLYGTKAPDIESSTGYYDLGAELGLGFRIPVGFAAFRAEVMAGYEHLFQNRTDGGTRHSSGFVYTGMAGFHFPVGHVELIAGGGVGGRMFKLREKDWVHRLDWQATAGVGTRLEIR